MVRRYWYLDWAGMDLLWPFLQLRRIDMNLAAGSIMHRRHGLIGARAGPVQEKWTRRADHAGCHRKKDYDVATRVVIVSSVDQQRLLRSSRRQLLGAGGKCSAKEGLRVLLCATAHRIVAARRHQSRRYYCL